MRTITTGHVGGAWRSIRGADHLPREDAEEAQEERLHGQVGEGSHQVPALSSIRLPVLTCSVADPDTGSGAFVTPGSGMNILDHISESLETIFWVKTLEFFNADPYPVSGNFRTPDPGSGNNIPDP